MAPASGKAHDPPDHDVRGNAWEETENATGTEPGMMGMENFGREIGCPDFGR